MDLKEELDMRCKLMFITRNLSIYDKISVIFFTCDKPYAGLKIMELLLVTESVVLQNKAFFSWIEKQMLFSSIDWQENLAEILAIIQNYKLVKYLGYDEKDLKKKIEMKEKLHCSGVKFVLYRICEVLNHVQTQALIESIDNAKKHEKIKQSKKFSQFLERNILDWTIKNIITIDENKKVNLEPVTRYLKELKMENLLVDLQNAVDYANFKFLKNIQTTQVHNLLDYYSITNKHDVGHCLIINEKDFPQSELNFKRRLGSNKDVERLKEVFTAYGFRISIHTNIIYNELIILLNNVAKSIPKSDSFFVLVILSHGSENVIYTSDSVPVPMDHIEMIFQAENCPSLIGKPKIFIIQSCQGQNWQRIQHKAQTDTDERNFDLYADAPNSSATNCDNKVFGPEKGDSIIAWSTVKGFASFRDIHNGSWYIEELCKELWKFGQFTDLVDILTLVNNNLRSKTYDGQFMVPSLLSSLSRKIQFPYDEEMWVKGRQLLVKRLFFEIYLVEFLRTCNLSYVDILKLNNN